MNYPTAEEVEMRLGFKITGLLESEVTGIIHAAINAYRESADQTGDVVNVPRDLLGRLTYDSKCLNGIIKLRPESTAVVATDISAAEELLDRARRQPRCDDCHEPTGRIVICETCADLRRLDSPQARDTPRAEAPEEPKAPRPDNRRQCTCVSGCGLKDDLHAILGNRWRCKSGYESIPGHTMKAEWAYCDTPRKDAK